MELASKIGVFQSGYWYVDWNGNETWDATDAQHIGYFGANPGDIPVLVTGMEMNEIMGFSRTDTVMSTGTATMGGTQPMHSISGISERIPVISPGSQVIGTGPEQVR